MKLALKGKTVLVTGSNRGIGKAFVEALIARGASRIYAAARQLSDAQALASCAPEVVVAMQLDITNASEIASAVASIKQLDILINNAGVAQGSGFSSAGSLEIAQAEMATNYFGSLNLTHALLPMLRESSAAAIVNISSIAGISNFPALGPYSASKAAVHSFIQGLRAELRNSNILVQGVYPGPVDTRMAEGASEKAAPAEVVDYILNGLENAEEDIFPDAFSQAMYRTFCQNPKSLEQQFAQMSGHAG